MEKKGNDVEQLRTSILADALRRMAIKIEKGYKLTNEQTETLAKLTREIIFDSSYKKDEKDTDEVSER